MKNHLTVTLPIGIGLGTAAGAVIGVTAHWISLWLPLGVGIGASLGVVFGSVMNGRSGNPE
jgi:hypothetical protein